MKTISFLIPGTIYNLIMIFAISSISVLTLDIVNDNRQSCSALNQSDEMFPIFIKWITFKEFEIKFADVKYSK